MKKDLIRYSMQLAMLKQLLSKSLITDKEYSIIKNKLMKDYDVASNFAWHRWRNLSLVSYYLHNEKHF